MNVRVFIPSSCCQQQGKQDTGLSLVDAATAYAGIEDGKLADSGADRGRQASNGRQSLCPHPRPQR